MNHGRSIWLAALAALLVLGSACGDDDGETKDSGTSHGGGGNGDKDASSGGGDKDASASGGSGGSGGGADKDGGSGEGGSGGDSALVDGGSSDGGGIELCGAETCASPMCCADAFQSLCGLQVNAKACLPPQPTSTMSDERCPSVSIMNGAFMIPSCCTDDGKCGINAQAAGMGCISLEEVIAYTAAMSGDGGGTGMGFGIMWPEPKACN